MEADYFSQASQITLFKSSNIVFPNAILSAILIVINGKIDRIHHYKDESEVEKILKVCINFCYFFIKLTKIFLILEICLLQDYNGTVYDFGSLVLMPGVIDTHVHVNQPGRTDWEGYETATRAAAAGGVTTIVDMPL